MSNGAGTEVRSRYSVFMRTRERRHLATATPPDTLADVDKVKVKGTARVRVRRYGLC